MGYKLTYYENLTDAPIKHYTNNLASAIAKAHTLCDNAASGCASCDIDAESDSVWWTAMYVQGFGMVAELLGAVMPDASFERIFNMRLYK